jgi:phospholipid/cholesterol/gamma-HCH transport system substrate-binding protein
MPRHPVRTDSIATIESLGVTGVSFVNQARVTAILTNLERSSADLGQALDDFSTVTRTVAASTEQIATFTDRLEAISAAAVTALETADTTLTEVTALARRAQQTLDTGDRALDSGRAALTSADLFIREDLPRLVDELTAAADGIAGQIDALGVEARTTLEAFRSTGQLASARLAEAEATIAATDVMLADMSRALASIDAAALRIDDFVAGEGTALVAETRGLIAEASRVVATAASFAETDLPVIVADVRAATETTAAVVEQVGGNLSAAARRVDGLSVDIEDTLDAVTETFRTANASLGRLDAAV